MFKKIILCGVLISSLVGVSNVEAASKPETLVVEKIKGNVVLMVSEKNDKPYFLKKSSLYKGVKVSDVFNRTTVKKKSKFTFNKKETIQRKKDVRDLMNELFEK